MNELSKDAVSWLTVGEDAAGQRIDNYLVRILKGVPKSHIYRILRSGEVRVNKGRVGPDTRLAVGRRRAHAAGACCRAGRPRTGDARPLRAGPKLPILFEDEALIALDKPSGLAVHGGSGIAHGVIEQLRAARPGRRIPGAGPPARPRDVRRPAARQEARGAGRACMRSCATARFDKRYLVLVRGTLARRDARACDLSLHKFSTQEGERRVRVEEDGQGAQTIFRRRRTWPQHDPPLALLEAELKTGRTHQIRVHLTHLGFPLAGDDKYGDFAWNKVLAKQGLKRMFLHAHTLAFAHPLTGEAIAFDVAAAGGPRAVRGNARCGGHRTRRCVTPRRDAFVCSCSTGTARWRIRRR